MTHSVLVQEQVKRLRVRLFLAQRLFNPLNTSAVCFYT